VLNIMYVKIGRSENYYVQRVAERRFPINHGNISQNIHKVVEQWGTRLFFIKNGLELSVSFTRFMYRPTLKEGLKEERNHYHIIEYHNHHF